MEAVLRLGRKSAEQRDRSGEAKLMSEQNSEAGSCGFIMNHHEVHGHALGGRDDAALPVFHHGMEIQLNAIPCHDRQHDSSTSSSPLDAHTTSPKSKPEPCQWLNTSPGEEQPHPTHHTISSLMPPPRSVPPPVPTSSLHPLPLPLLSLATVDGESDSEASCRSTPPGDPHIISAVPVPFSIDTDTVNAHARTAEERDFGSGKTPAPSGKKRKRDKGKGDGSRLSFADELEGSDDGAPSMSLSKATSRRFKSESKHRSDNSTPHKEIFNNFSPSLNITSAGPSSPRMTLAELTAMLGEAGPPGEWWTCISTRQGARVVDDDDDGPTSGRRLKVRHGVSAKQGKRPYMEDTNFALRCVAHYR